MGKLSVRDRNKSDTTKKPNWEYRFEGASIGGKRQFISKMGFRTKKEATDAGLQAFADYNRSGEHFEPQSISVSDYLDYWFEHYCKLNLKYNTQLAYIEIVNKYLKPRLGMYRLGALTSATLQNMTDDISLNGLSKSTLTGILSTLSCALNYAVEPMRYIQFNPMQYVKQPRCEKPPRERIILSGDEWDRIIGRFQPPSRFYIPLMIGYYTGLRISEVFGLTWDDVDLEKRTLTVRKQIIKRNFAVEPRQTQKVIGKKEDKSSWYFGTTKTRASNRTIDFGETLARALRQEKARQLENELTYGEYYNILVIKSEIDEKGKTIKRILPISKSIHTDFPRARMVCIDENGQYTSSDSFKYASRVIHYELGIAFDFHSLRHTHATILIENGASVKSVQTRLGHDGVETTLQTYVHDTQPMRDQTVDIFETASMNRK